MKKIEKQLRESRENGISGLMPPADGWDAVSARINENAGNTSTTATPGTGKGFVANFTWGTWLLSIAGVMLLGVLLSSLIADQPSAAEASLATSTPALHKGQIIAGTVEAITAGSAKEQVERTILQQPVRTVGATRISVIGAGKSAGRTSRNELILSPKEPMEEPARRSLQNVEKASVSATGSTQYNTDDQVISDTEVDPENGLKATSSLDREVAESQLTDRRADPAFTEIADPGAMATPKDNAATAKLFPDSDSVTVSPVSEGLTVSTFAVKELLPEITYLSVADADFGELPDVTPGQPLALNRKGKPRVRPEYQVSAALSGHYLRGFNNSRFFSRDVTTGGASRLFVLPSGEPLPVRFDRSDLKNNLRRSIRFDVGINRQFSSGFLARAKLGLYYATNDRRSDDFEEVTGLMVREDFYERRFIAPIELGFQYTFRKRYRFRPYLGVNYIMYVANNSVQRTTFFDAQTQSQGLIGQVESRGVSLADWDFSLTAGFQYKLSNRVSAGISLYVHSQGAYFVESPFGFEVRYSLK